MSLKTRQAGATKPSGVLEKIEESRFFLDLMSSYEQNLLSSYERTGEIKKLLFCLSAFLSSFRSILFRLKGVTAQSRHAKSLLDAHLQAHPQIRFLQEASNVEVHADGVTVWPLFRVGDYSLFAPGPLELHFFSQIASQVRVVGLRLENQKSDLPLLEYCREAVNLMEDFVKQNLAP